MMADVELSRGYPLFYRNADANSYGVLNVREEFAAEHPEIVQKVLAVYERGRQWALANPASSPRSWPTAAKLPEPVAAKQLERTAVRRPAAGRRRSAQTIVAAGQGAAECRDHQGRRRRRRHGGRAAAAELREQRSPPAR